MKVLQGVLIACRIRLFVLLLLVWVAVFGLFIWSPSLVTGLASSVSDTYYAYNPHTPDPKIVFVAVDHAAVSKIGRWPWPRDELARYVRKLNQAAVVTLDMVFSEKTTEVQDRALGSAFEGMPVIGGFFLNGVINSQPGKYAMDQLANSALTNAGQAHVVSSKEIELSVENVISGMAAQAPMNTWDDPDALFRHYPLVLKYQQMTLPTLGLQTLRLYLNTEVEFKGPTKSRLEIGSHRVSLDQGSKTRLNLYPEDKFQVISFAEVADPNFDPLRVSGKIVLLGVKEAGITDIRATPLGQYPGPLLHATFMANVLGDHTLTEIGHVSMGWLLVLVLVICFAGSFLNHIMVRTPAYLLLIAVSYAFGMLLYVQFNIWLESAYLIVATVLSALLIEMSLLGIAKEQSRKLRGAFSAYVPPALVDRIAAHPDALRLGGEKKLITVLFSDIRGFTSLSETMTPELLASTMLAYFQPMTEAIFEEGGTLDKYIGDAIMALFNVPLDQVNHAEAACRAAAAMQFAQLRINEALQVRGVAPMRTGIGINTGFAVVGNLGSHIRFNYTAIGDCVNLASRLESSTKSLGVDIVIGESTYELVKNLLPCKPLGETYVAGKEKPQRVYALIWQEMEKAG